MAIGSLDEAIELAAAYHRDQVDKAGEPYILHPLRVMFRLRDEGCDVPTQIVGVLHDTVEDTDLSVGTIHALFGYEIAECVSMLTREDGEKYADYIHRVKLNPTSRRVKLADLQDNLDPKRHAWAKDDDTKATLASLVGRYRKAVLELETVQVTP